MDLPSILVSMAPEREEMMIGSAYVTFCDDNNLQRIDATPEIRLQNLDLMASALLAMREKQLAEIANRCPHCGGSGAKDGKRTFDPQLDQAIANKVSEYQMSLEAIKGFTARENRNR